MAKSRIDAEALAGAGYRVSRCRRGVSASDEYRNLYQRAIRTDGPRLYFVNFWEYDFRPHDLGITYAAEVQFRRGDLHVSVEPLFGPDVTVAEAEEFFAQMYLRMEFTPYDAE